MANFYAFLDDSFSNEVFCLGGLLIQESKLENILKEWRNFKKSLGLEELDPIKWSLGDNKEEKNIKDKLKKCFSGDRDWLTKFHCKTLHRISTFDLKLVASLHQDIRGYKKLFETNKLSPIDFYLWAFRFLLQRIWYQIKDSGHKVIVILDKPPQSKKLKGSEAKICKCYRDAYEQGFRFDSNQIPPLKNAGFFECPFIAKSDFSSFVQISDFCVGSIRERARDLLKNNQDSHSRFFLNPILALFYGSNEGNIINRGLVVFPKDKRLYYLMTNEIKKLQDEFTSNS